MQCFVFDLDGTLIDSRQDITNAVNAMRAAFGLPPLPLETVTGYVGDGVGKLVERAMTGTGIACPEAMQVMRTAYRANINRTACLYPGVLKTLQELRCGGNKLALLSNKPDELTQAVMRDLGIAPYFDVIFGGRADIPLKPDPACLFEIMKILDVSPEHIWMTGDGFADLRAGHNAGTKCAWASYGFGKTQGETYDLELKTISDILNVC